MYPRVIDVAEGDFSAPLQLVAQRLEFDDPRSGAHRVFVSDRRLTGSAAFHSGFDQRKIVADEDVTGPR